MKQVLKYYDIRKNDKLAFSVMLGTVIIFMNLHVDEVFQQEWFYDFTKDGGVNDYLNSCTVSEFPEKRSALRYYILCAQSTFLDNYRIVPLLFSIGMIVMSFFTVKKMTNSSIAAVMTSVILASSPIINKFATSATYDQGWAFFFLSALYFAYGNHKVMSGVFFVSVLMKTLTLIYIPMFIYTLYSQNKNKKLVLALVAITATLGGFVMSSDPYVFNGLAIKESFDTAEFTTEKLLDVFYGNVWEMGVVLSSIPIVTFLAISKRLGAKHILIWMAGFIVMGVIMLGFTNQTLYAYRITPMIFFSAATYGIFIDYIVRKF